MAAEFESAQRDLYHARSVLRVLIESEVLALMDGPEGAVEAALALLEGVTKRLDELLPRIGGAA